MVKWCGLPQPWAGAQWQASQTISRLEVLGSGAWEERVRKIILEESEHNEDFFWALEVAEDRRPSWLQKTLRARLTSEYQRRTVRLDPPGENGFSFDEVLLTLAATGGNVDEKELAYLEHFGFACDPRKWLTDALWVLPALRKRQAFEKILEAAKYTLSESVSKVLNEEKDGTALGASISDYGGRGEVYVSLRKGEQTVGIAMTTADGFRLSTARENVDQSELAQALKIGLVGAVQIALNADPGTATGAWASYGEGKKPAWAVHIYRDGKTRIVTVDGELGKPTGVKDFPIEE
jgi:hypothetical protein